MKCCPEILQLASGCIDAKGKDYTILLFSDTNDFAEDAIAVFCVDGFEVGRYEGVRSDYNGVPNRAITFTVTALDFENYENRIAIGDIKLFEDKGVHAQQKLSITKNKI